MNFRQILIILIFVIPVGILAQTDTLFLKNDSSIIISSCDNHVKVYDKNKKIYLFDMPGWAGSSKLVKKPNNIYHIVVEGYLPELGKTDWKKYEFVRYILWINGNEHSFYKSYANVNYSKLSQIQIDSILENAKDIYNCSYFESQDPIEKEIYLDCPDCYCYTRNIGLLALGILNGDTNCLKRFNEVGMYCKGGVGCETYRSFQKELSYTDYELWYRNKSTKPRFQFYLKKK